MQRRLLLKLVKNDGRRPCRFQDKTLAKGSPGYLRSLWLISEHIKRSKFEPIEFETDFRDKGKYPPIEIELDSGQRVKLTGRIDRVDQLVTDEGKYLRIIDYKSGSKDFKLEDAYYGLQIQLLTYLDALWKEKDGYLPGGAFYVRLDDPVVSGNPFMSTEEIEKAIMKKLRMNGLVLADVKLIRQMDLTLEGTSLIIPVRLRKGDVIIAAQLSAAAICAFGP